MVDVRISRVNVDVAADPGAVAGISRVEAEVATPAGEATAAVDVQVSRLAVEVLHDAPVQVSVSRIDAEVATPSGQSNSVDSLMISRLSVEVAYGVIERAAISRVDAEVATKVNEATATVDVQVSRVSMETAFRRGSAGIVDPLDLADGIEVFLHNWVDEAILSTSYPTDVSQSAVTGAESRVALTLRPDRTIRLVWEEDDEQGDKQRLDRLLVMLRKLTDERIAIPLYMDQRELAADYLSTDDTVFFDTSKGRWGLGARVVIVQLDMDGSYDSHSFHIIESMGDDHLTFDAALGVDVAAGSFIMPMMDCEITLEADLKYDTALDARVEMELQEVQGSSALLPTKSDFPTDAQSFDDAPIFDVEPDWIQGIKVGRSRQGQRYHQGRGDRVYKAAARSRQTHEMLLTGNRDDMWRVVEFFDTRRGRTRTFWLIDQQQVWDTAQVDPAGTFVSVNAIGDFDDFKAELEGGWVGLIMSDGTMYVREAVTVQEILTVFRITVNPDLPAGLNANDVALIARARRTRFASDEMEERWKHSGYMSTTLSFIETLEEKDVDTV